MLKNVECELTKENEQFKKKKKGENQFSWNNLGHKPKMRHLDHQHPWPIQKTRRGRADIYKTLSRSSTHLFPSHFSFSFSLSDRRNHHTFLLYLLHNLRSQSILQQPQLTHGSFSLSSSFTTQFLHIDYNFRKFCLFFF